MAKIKASTLEEFKKIDDFIQQLPKEIKEKVVDAEFSFTFHIEISPSYVNDGYQVKLPKCHDFMELSEGEEYTKYSTREADYIFKKGYKKIIFI